MDIKFDCEYTNELVCPYCGEEQSDSYEAIDGDEECGTTSCGSCNRSFDFSVSREVHYSTTCLEGEHTYVDDPRYIEDCQRCERCGDYKFKRFN